MLSLEDGKKAVIFARNVIENFVKNESEPSDKLADIFNEKQGAFVTIHTFPETNLRGCIGIPLPVMSLKQAVIKPILRFLDKLPLGQIRL